MKTKEKSICSWRLVSWTAEEKMDPSMIFYKKVPLRWMNSIDAVCGWLRRDWEEEEEEVQMKSLSKQRSWVEAGLTDDGWMEKYGWYYHHERLWNDWILDKEAENFSLPIGQPASLALDRSVHLFIQLFLTLSFFLSFALVLLLDSLRSARLGKEIDQISDIWKYIRSIYRQVLVTVATTVVKIWEPRKTSRNRSLRWLVFHLLTRSISSPFLISKLETIYTNTIHHLPYLKWSSPADECSIYRSGHVLA